MQSNFSWMVPIEVMLGSPLHRRAARHLQLMDRIQKQNS